MVHSKLQIRSMKLNIQKSESDAKSQRQADRDHHGVQETADAADVVAVKKVTHRVAERDSRDKVEDTGGEGDLRSRAPSEHEARAGYHGGKAGGQDDDHPIVNPLGGQFLLEEETVDRGDEHYQHRDKIPSEKLAERRVRQPYKNQHKPRVQPFLFKNIPEYARGLRHIKSLFHNLPAQSAEVGDGVEIDPVGGDLPGHGVGSLLPLVPKVQHNAGRKDGEVSLRVPTLGDPAEILLNPDRSRPAGVELSGEVSQEYALALQLVMQRDFLSLHIPSPPLPPLPPLPE